MSAFRRFLAAAALLTAVSPAAHAYEFFTPVSQAQNGTSLYCAIVNVGATPATVSATVQSMVDGTDITAINICPQSPATLAPGTACFSYSSQTGTHSGYCHFTASTTKVRANLIIFGTNGDVLTTTPATR
jgi:hypothetical protein